MEAPQELDLASLRAKGGPQASQVMLWPSRLAQRCQPLWHPRSKTMTLSSPSLSSYHSLERNCSRRAMRRQLRQQRQHQRLLHQSRTS